MKAFIVAGTLAAGLAVATPSHALDLTGSYLATFAVANGNNKTVCFQLTSTGKLAPYADAGTVTSTKYPDYAGTYVVYQGGFHLAFAQPGHDSVTVTGTIAKSKLTHSSATEFTDTGTINNVGTLTGTTNCSGN